MTRKPDADAEGRYRPVAGDDVMRAIVDAAPDGVVLADQSGTILLVNRQAEELFGYDGPSLLGRSVDELLPERLRQVHGAHRTRYRAEPRTRPMGVGQTFFGRRADGTEFPVEVSLSPFTIGDQLRIIAMVRDVSERLAIESEARRVKDILNATRDAVLIFDADTLRFVYVNQGAVDQVGYSAAELLEMTMLHISPEFDEPRLRALLDPLQRGEQSSVMFTTVHRRRDGTDIPVEIILQASDIQDGKPRAFVKIVRDVTERLADELRLREAEQSLRLVEERDRIARDLHDVVIQRLFAVGLTVQGVHGRSSDPEASQRLAGVVDELDETIREIRSVIFSLQSGMMGPRPGLRAEVTRVIAEERGVLGFEPRVMFDGVIDAAPDRVAEQLLPTLREILSNVGRHAAASSVLVSVTGGDALTLRVEDDGIGIGDDPEYGNGLKNIRKRAAELDGSCEVTSAPGAGTTVEWSVPMAAERQ
jgi:two-component system sensor histidine kinase DevS